MPATAYGCAWNGWLSHTVVQNTSGTQYLMIILKQTVLQRTFLKKTVFQKAVLRHNVLQMTSSEARMCYPDDIACFIYFEVPHSFAFYPLMLRTAGLLHCSS